MWESEAGLNQLLGHLPDVPLSSNFTSLVLQAVDREAAKPRPSFLGWLQHLAQRPLPKLAWALLLVALGVFGLFQREAARREQMADGLVKFSRATSVADPKLFEDFDAIRGLGQASTPSDDALFTVMNQSQ